jgi:hypothetical protein
MLRLRARKIRLWKLQWIAQQMVLPLAELGARLGKPAQNTDMLG